MAEENAKVVIVKGDEISEFNIPADAGRVVLSNDQMRVGWEDNGVKNTIEIPLFIPRPILPLLKEANELNRGRFWSVIYIEKEGIKTFALEGEYGFFYQEVDGAKIPNVGTSAVVSRERRNDVVFFITMSIMRIGKYVKSRGKKPVIEKIVGDVVDGMIRKGKESNIYVILRGGEFHIGTSFGGLRVLKGNNDYYIAVEKPVVDMLLLPGGKVRVVKNDS